MPNNHDDYCVLLVGHDFDKPGAKNPDGTLSEYDYNLKVCRELNRMTLINKCIGGYKVPMMTQYNGFTFPYLGFNGFPEGEMKFAIEMHCNAFNGKARGNEILMPASGGPGCFDLARIFDLNGDMLPNRNRGVKEVGPRSRGSKFFQRHPGVPRIIVEPFFIDNEVDFIDVELVAGYYYESITRAFDTL